MSKGQEAHRQGLHSGSPPIRQSIRRRGDRRIGRQPVDGCDSGRLHRRPGHGHDVRLPQWRQAAPDRAQSFHVRRRALRQGSRSRVGQVCEHRAAGRRAFIRRIGSRRHRAWQHERSRSLHRWPHAARCLPLPPALSSPEHRPPHLALCSSTLRGGHGPHRPPVPTAAGAGSNAGATRFYLSARHAPPRQVVRARCAP